MFYQAAPIPEKVVILRPDIISQTPPKDYNFTPENKNNSHILATPAPAETLAPEFSSQKPVQKNDIESNILLLSVLINGQEVGNLDVLREHNTLLIPLEDFAQISGFTLATANGITEFKTPLGLVKIPESDLRKVNGIVYISDALLREKLLTNVELKMADLALVVDLPWRRGSGQSNKAIDLLPEVKPYGNGLSNFRQDLTYYNNSSGTSWQSSTTLGGSLAGGAWHLRLDNNFLSQPSLSEYFYFKRSGDFLYQAGRQQIGLSPLLSNINLTGAQIGFTNLPIDNFNSSDSASELLPRRSQPVQTFSGKVPPASFVQLRVSGVVVAQQQVGLTGEYLFRDINLPSSQSNNIELYVFDRSNLNVPTEVRSLRLNASDLLLPAGGNTQLAGVGVTGSLIQNSLFQDLANSTPSGQLAGFYQVRQGISPNLTFEGGVQALSSTTQGQAGLVWRLANPLILGANVGTSNGILGYTADLNFQLNRLQIVGSSQSFPSGYFPSTSNTQSYTRDNSLDVQYRFTNTFNLGFIARDRQNIGQNTNLDDYVWPTFSIRPFSTLSLRGGPDINGLYLFNALFQPTAKSRFSFNTFGNIYTSNFSYDLSRKYQLGLDTESGDGLPTRYTVAINGNASSLYGLSWRLGIAYRGSEISPVAGLSTRLIPGLYASLDFQGIPSRYQSTYGGLDDNHLTFLLVSDLSFAGGKISPAESASVSRDKGGISGKIKVAGGRKGFDLSGASIQVFNHQNQNVGSAQTDSRGNFFIGNLPPGVYMVQLDTENLPIEISLKKTSVVAQVAGSSVTNLEFRGELEYGLAGRITDATGKSIPFLDVELVNAEGKKVAESATNEFGLYRLDGVPSGSYQLRVPAQDHISNADALPTKQITVNSDFLYDQNLQLPISPLP